MGVLIGTVSGVSWIVIEVMTILNPSETIPISTPLAWTVPIYLITAVSAFLLPFLAAIRERTRFLRSFFVSFTLLIAVSWMVGSLIHRDFFAFTTPVVLIFITIFMHRIADLDVVRNKVVVFPRLAFAAVVVFVLWTGWIMMMSYAIVTRTEPRWIESIAYNLTNGVLGVVMLYVGITLYDRSRRTIRRFNDGRWYLDERNISSLLSPQEQRIVQLFFVHPDRPITCRELIGRLYEDADRLGEALRECEECLTQQWTASQCSTYRNIKNRISDTKKYLELLQIGTIVPVSEKPREIKELGWRLRLFDDVRIAPGGER